MNSRIADLRQTRSRGFTLIELLVVISILSLLVSILLPALTGARRSGRAIVCESHLRTLGQGMQIYANFYDDVVPLGESRLDDGSMHFAASLLPALSERNLNEAGPYQSVSLEAKMLELVGDHEAFQCPDFPEERQRLDFVVNSFIQPYTLTDDPGPPGDGPINQFANEVVERRLFASLTRMRKDTSQLIYLTEAHAKLPTNSGQYHDLFYSSQLPLASYPRIANDKRHPSGINALFFDTHVERMPLEHMDVGWPSPRVDRLRWFTTAPLPNEETEP